MKKLNKKLMAFLSLFPLIITIAIFLILLFSLNATADEMCDETPVNNEPIVISNNPNNGAWDGLTFTAAEAGADFKLKHVWSGEGEDPGPANLEYSTDAQTWIPLAVNTPVTLQNVDDCVFLRGENPNGFSKSKEDVSYFEIKTKIIKSSGNANSLFASENYNEVTAIPKYCFTSLFRYCIGLISAPKLPATFLSEGCYYEMFYQCNGLQNAPDLPSTNLAPKCYYSMFLSSSITKAPELPATELEEQCYKSMFSGCKDLIEAPELPAKKLADNCYRTMFDRTKITNLIAYFEAWEPDLSATQNWLRGVPEGGTFVCPANLDVSSNDDSTVPDTWSVQRLVKEVNATPFSGQWDGQPHCASVEVVEPYKPCTVQYSADGENFQNEPLEFTDCGNYTVYYRVAFNDTGYTTGDGSTSVEITAPPQPAPSPEGGTGSSQTGDLLLLMVLILIAVAGTSYLINKHGVAKR